MLVSQEWYMLNDKGQRISREPWTVAYADDEDISSGNKTADKIFDLQESTYWSTNKDVKFPITSYWIWAQSRH